MNEKITEYRNRLIDNDLNSIKLSLSPTDRTIWYIDGDSPPTQSNLTTNDFVNSKLLSRIKSVRLVGTAANAKLILILHGLRESGRIKQIELCSPMVCQNNSERADCRTTLMNMRRWYCAASVGGWHALDRNDYASYLLANTLQQHDNEVTDDARRILKNHPAWESLSFIDHIDINYAAKLVGLLLDPRWYIDPTNPNSGAKLKAFLGLTPRTQGYASGLSGYVHGIHPDRCKLVLNTWKTSTFPPKNINKPNNFLWRIWEKHGRGVTGDLRASQTLISYLRHAWSAELYRGLGKTTESLFVPEYFFKHEEEAKSYTQHLKTFRARKYE